MISPTEKWGSALVTNAAENPTGLDNKNYIAEDIGPTVVTTGPAVLDNQIYIKNEVGLKNISVATHMWRPTCKFYRLNTE